MLDKKFLDLILVGEYLILVAVYLTLCLFTILFSACREKSWFFSNFSVSVVWFMSSLLLLYATKLWLTNLLPLLRSSVLVCWSCLLAPPLNNEFFSSISRLLLTKLKSELTLTKEKVIDCLSFVLLATKEVKCVSFLFLLK